MEFGKLFIVGLQGVELSDTEKTLLKKLQPLGIILFKRNIAQSENWIEKLQSLLSDVAFTTGREDLLVSIDHEGGRVHRLREPVTHFQPAKCWKARAAQVGSAMGKELNALGFHIAYAPVLDVLTAEGNCVIGDRALDSDPQQVSLYAAQFLDGLEKEGVLGCLKHFPGHGSTLADSHFELPVNSLDKQKLFSCDLLPFVELASKARLIMSAHILYPELDPEYPATLSKCILTDLLRGELGYSGAVISDALEMGALSHLSIADKAIQSVSAGVDILLTAEPTECTTPLELAMQLEEALRNALNAGSLSKNSVERALQKNDQLLHNFPQVKRQALDILGCAEHLKLNAQLNQS